jgi:hypothetical protein
MIVVKENPKIRDHIDKERKKFSSSTKNGAK